MKNFLNTEDKLFTKAHTLMSKLRTINGRAPLCRVFDPSPLLKNDTSGGHTNKRWWRDT
ncbi:hypothetical protein L917_11342 [Phytophthora nicotianae]|uniref:Uncharacterized protein n=1 Tax=Phytophthora nicotianae TaxID=4792 RepID=W2KX54_PHYNI|nr:hypothetical protein L917_11342 [Phytophthora nicotianae]